MLVAVMLLACAPAMAQYEEEPTALDIFLMDICDSTFIPVMSADMARFYAYMNYTQDMYDAGVDFDEFVAIAMDEAAEANAYLEYDSCYIDNVEDIACDEAAAYVAETEGLDYDLILAAMEHMGVGYCTLFDMYGAMVGDDYVTRSIVLAGYMMDDYYQVITALDIPE